MRHAYLIWACCFSGFWAASVPQTASAGPVEELAVLALHPRDPKVMALRYQNGGGGVFYTSDGGDSWKLMCGTMIAPGEKVEGSMALAGDGRTLVGVFMGLWQGSNNGCNWSKAPELSSIRVSDVSGHPSDPDVSFAVTGSGSEQAQNGLLRRDASGTWTEVGTRDPAIISRVRAIDLEGGGLRFYQSAQRGMLPGEGGTQVPNYMIRSSDDEGMTWTEHPISVPVGTMRLEAIDPTRPDRIVVSIDRPSPPDSVMVSSDRGATFTEYLSLTDLGGISFAPDGRIWVGDYGNIGNVNADKGLWAAPSLDSPATKLSGDYQVQCLTYQAATDTLFACQRWQLGKVDPASGAFTKVFALEDATEFVTCEGTDAPSMCKTQLCGDYCGPLHFARAPLCSVYNEPTCGPLADSGDAAPLGGSPASGAGGTTGQGGSSAAGGAAGAASAPSKSGGCATSPSGPLTGPAGQLAFGLLLSAAVLWRRTRRRAEFRA
jgi:hypothetical protein